MRHRAQCGLIRIKFAVRAGGILRAVVARWTMPLRFLPFEPQRVLLERLLREAYPDALRDGAFEPLRGRWLRIEVNGGPGWNVTMGADAPIVVAGPVRWDVRVAASLDDYVQLANQQADPDTLFFQRRLVIEGDTELGLVVKNLIFGNELQGVPAHIAHLMGSLRGFFLGESELLVPALTLPPLPRALARCLPGRRRLDADKLGQARGA